MENKETNLGNEVTPEMERDKVNLEQQNNELSVENEKETAGTEKPMGMDEVSVVNKEQTYGLEEANPSSRGRDIADRKLWNQWK